MTLRQPQRNAAQHYGAHPAAVGGRPGPAGPGRPGAERLFSAGRDRGISFTLEPYALEAYALEAGLKQAERGMGDKAVRCWRRPVQGANCTRPEGKGAGKAWLDRTDLTGVNFRRAARGVWGVCRLLQSPTIKKQEGNTCLMEWQLNGKWVQSLSLFRNKLNPFKPAVCSLILPASLP